MDAPRRILVRGVNWLGDAVMTMPVFYRLREAYPAAHIAVLTLPKLAELYRCQPAVDAVLTLTRDEPMRAVASRLRAENFDTGLILTNSARAAFPFWLAGIPHRTGYAWRGRVWMLTHPVSSECGGIIIHRRSAGEIKRLAARQDQSEPLFATPRGKPAVPDFHHTQRYLHLAAQLGADPTPIEPRLIVPKADIQAVIQKFNLPYAGSGCPLFGLNPGAEYGPAKRWPEERFINAAVALQRRLRCRWVLIGGAAEVELLDRIAARIQEESGAGRMAAVKSQAVWNLGGQTSLSELCAALRACDLLLTNDTGPMHVAAAVGTPVVVPFGSTSPELTGPGLPGDSRHRLLKSSAACAPCFQRACPIDFRCMNSIGVSQVVEAVESLMADSMERESSIESLWERQI